MDLDALKSQWLADPCWDLEETAGFEAHRAELLSFRLAREAEWRERANAELDALAASVGVPGNRALAARLQSLERRLAALEGR